MKPTEPNYDLLPQVGAVLQLNADSRTEPGRGSGSRYWDLDGSCILIAPKLALGIQHTFGPNPDTSRYGIFFPGEGIIPLADQAAVESLEAYHGDNLVLIRFKREVKYADGLPARHVKEDIRNYARIVGYGGWETRQGPLQDGVQRVKRVRLRAGPVFDNLDAGWFPQDNNGLRATRNMSGSPWIWGDNSPRSFIAIHRQFGVSGEQLASRIGKARESKIAAAVRQNPAQRGRALALGTVLRAAQIKPKDAATKPNDEEARPNDGKGSVVVEIEPGHQPEEAAKLQLTLASHPFFEGRPRLQMQIYDNKPNDAALSNLAADDTQSGAYLFREHQIGEGRNAIYVGIVPTTNGGPLPYPVEVQLYGYFTS